MLVLSTGDAHIVSGPGLVGRRPTPEAGESARHLITVVDESRAVSKTHLAFGFEDGAFWVSDRWSANGSAIVVPGEASSPMEPGRRYRAVLGAVVILSTVSIRVDRAAPTTAQDPPQAASGDTSPPRG